MPENILILLVFIATISINFFGEVSKICVILVASVHTDNTDKTWIHTDNDADKLVCISESLYLVAGFQRESLPFLRSIISFSPAQVHKNAVQMKQ